MSQENVEIARKVNEAIRRGDWDVVAAYYDPGISIRTDPTWPEQRIYGRAAAMNFVRNGCETWGLDVRIEEIVDLGDRLLIRMRWNTHARHTGIGGNFRFSELVTYRDGRAILVEFFIDHEQALQALGLAG
jgi:ketosteroid isomerase-like protein